MSRVPHAPGGILPPLGFRITQKKVVPADVGHKGDEEVPDTSSGSRTSFAKSLHRAEALLQNHLNPIVKCVPYHHSGDACLEDDEDELVLSQSRLMSSSAQLVQVERSLIALGGCLMTQKCPGTQTLKGFFKRASADSPHSEFYYHPAYASVGQHGSRLHMLTQQRHYLKLAKEYAIRLKGSWDFIQKLTDLLASQQTAARTRSQVPASVISTGQLKMLCEELRTHTSHWSALQRRVRRDCWLQPLLLQKQGTLSLMKTTLSRLAFQAIGFMDHCIGSSMRSLSCAGTPSLSREELSDIFRGVEIYNQVVSDSASQLAECWTSTGEVHLTLPGPKDSLIRGGAQRRAGAYPIARVLYIMSEERGKQAADKLHWFLLQQDEFTSNVSRSCFNCVDWKKAKVPSFLNNLLSVTDTKQWRKALSRPKLGERQPAPSQLGTSRQLEAICTEDQQLMRNILDVLVASTDTFWHHFLNKPKPDRPPPAEYQPGTQRSRGDVTGLLVINNDLDVIQTEERLDIQGCLGLAHQLGAPTSEAVEVLHTQYRAMLWKEFRSSLLDRFYHRPVSASALGSLSQCKEGASMEVVQNLEDMLKKSSVPEECMLEVWNLCLHLLTRTVLMFWDREFCRALGSGLNDKCLHDPSGMDRAVQSRTAGLLLELFPPLGFLLECLHSRKLPDSLADPALLSLRLTVLSRCLATLQSTCSWVMTKAYQFLSSWSLNQFLLVTQADLALLTAETERMLVLVREACPEEAVRRAGTNAQEAQLCLQIHSTAASIQRFSSEVLQLFSDDCRRMSAELFLQTMPMGKHWRPRLRAELPSDPSEYAMAAAQTVIGQVLQGIQQLPQDSQIAALTQVMSVFMEAWMDHILHHKIKFSLQGALQLKQDFDMVRDMIRSQDSDLSQDVRESILSHRVFQRVDNAIICLLQQPTSKSYMPSIAWDPLRNCCSSSCSRNEDFNSGSLNSLESLDIQTARNGAVLEVQTSAMADLISKMRRSSNPESYLTANQQEWLSLRLHSGRHWRVPGLSCINRAPES